ncbi:hypothetical protein EVAR_72014_1 [Eumeta japonica]|uniref:Uncharacterized protein n=1 Tax=Eumeta variegata TaxID=151549 RepID=A0A4C1T564_EUMVA|nr:hypothetical protein EVAR_72014_1 [Eumeta japonica]
MLEDMQISEINVIDLVPRTYVAKFGYIEGLSAAPNEDEAVLVMENLAPLGYQPGPRLVLSEDHLTAMCRALGIYHSFSYAQSP